jgi:nitrite reductase/ring-hydroxylating ferredoxin subunit
VYLGLIFMEKKFICQVNELSKNKTIIKYYEDIRDELILFKNEDNKIKCFSSVCPHVAGEVVYENCQLKCRWHGLKFDKTGKSLNGKVQLYLREYKVEIIDNKIYVQEK